MAEVRTREDNETVGRLAVASLPLVLVLALGLDQGGFEPSAWVWAGALAAWAAALALSLTGDAGRLRVARPWLAATGGLLAWTIASAIWSARPAQSVLEARRMVVYAALVLALALLARRGATRVLVVATHAAVTALLVVALARYLLGARRYDPFESFLLSRPVGYANAVGVLAALAIVLGVGLASHADGRAARAGAAATVPVLALALALTQSRASWLALAAGLAVAALLEREPQELLRVCVVLAPPALLLVGLAVASRLTDTVRRPWPHAGVLLAVVGLAAAAAGAAGVAFGGRSSTVWGRRRRVALVAAAIVLALAGAAFVARTGATEPRASYWHVAWRDTVAHPLLGSGAGTFGFAWANSGLIVLRGGALDAHSLYLETLAELGPLGLLLVAAFLLLPLRRVLVGRNVTYVATAAAAYVVFLVHAGLDWDWEMPVVVVAGLCCGAAVLFAGADEASAPLPRRVRALVLVVAVVLGGCAIAGGRSQTEPGAQKAPPSGAFRNTRRQNRVS